MALRSWTDLSVNQRIYLEFFCFLLFQSFFAPLQKERVEKKLPLILFKSWIDYQKFQSSLFHPQMNPQPAIDLSGKEFLFPKGNASNDLIRRNAQNGSVSGNSFAEVANKVSKSLELG